MDKPCIYLILAAAIVHGHTLIGIMQNSINTRGRRSRAQQKSDFFNGLFEQWQAGSFDACQMLPPTTL